MDFGFRHLTQQEHCPKRLWNWPVCTEADGHLRSARVALEGPFLFRLLRMFLAGYSRQNAANALDDQLRVLFLDVVPALLRYD